MTLKGLLAVPRHAVTLLVFDLDVDEVDEPTEFVDVDAVVDARDRVCAKVHDVDSRWRTTTTTTKTTRTRAEERETRHGDERDAISVERLVETRSRTRKAHSFYSS